MSGFKRYDEDFKQSFVNLYQTGKTQTEKATLFCTIFIKCFLLSGHSLSDGCLIIETTVNAMMIPPVDIVLGFKG